MEEKKPVAKEIKSKVLPVWKFILLYLSTFTFYQYYWIYKSWKYLKKEEKLKISPFLRTVLYLFFYYSLASRYKVFLHSKGIKSNYSPALLSVALILFILSWRLKDPYWIIATFSFFSYLPLLNAMNSYREKEETGKVILKSKLALLQYIPISLGFGLYLFSVLNLVLDSLGISVFPESKS